MLAQHPNDLILGKTASPHRSSPSDELTYQWHDFRGAGQRRWHYMGHAGTSRWRSYAASWIERASRWRSRPSIASSFATGSVAKKTGHAAERERADALNARKVWFDGQLDLEPERLVFIDETSTATNMTRGHGRCHRGERLRMGYPHGHRKTTTLVAGLRMSGMVAQTVLDGPINGEWFEAYVDQVLVPDLKRGNVVIMDNLSRHERASIRALIEAAGAYLLFLPPYSPEFNPIEKAFYRLKAMLRKAGERTVSGLWSLIGKLVDLFQPQECVTILDRAAMIQTERIRSRVSGGDERRFPDTVVQTCTVHLLGNSIGFAPLEGP
jgi:transposase